MIPVEEVNIRLAYGKGSDAEQKFIANLALFLATFLREHGQTVEVTEESNSEEQGAVQSALAHKMVRITVAVQTIELQL